MAGELFNENADSIDAVPDDRRQEYRDISALAATPQIDSLSRPRTRIEDYVEIDADGQTSRAELVKLHLMSDEGGDAPITKLNDWEGEVVKREIAREGALAWYRNPPRQSADSLGVAYRDEATGNWRSMHPDFIFFHSVDGEARASIVDPHGHHLETRSSSPARCVRRRPDSSRRIKPYKIGGVMKVPQNERETALRMVGIQSTGSTIDIAINHYSEGDG